MKEYKGKIERRGFCEVHNAEYLTESGKCPICEKTAGEEQEAQKNKKKGSEKNDRQPA